MRYIKNTLSFETERRSAVTLGKFDGLHRGHMLLVDRVLELGKQEGLETVVFTFAVPPSSQVAHEPAHQLLTNEERRLRLENQGLDMLVECPCDEAGMHMEPEAFVKEYLVDRLHGEYLAVGPDFRFGYQRKGTPQFLEELGKKYGFYTEILEKEKYEGRDISSTYVREELDQGHIEKVNQLLGYPYFTKGEIVHGRQLGRTIGIPTANLIPPSEKKLPPNGVYITESIIQGRTYQGITNVGYKPTVKENFLGVETYLFSCNADLYGQEAEVKFYRYLRPEVKFASLEELKNQMMKDIQKGKDYFNGI